jgi:hypothetical protein
MSLIFAGCYAAGLAIRLSWLILLPTIGLATVLGATLAFPF